MENTNLVFAEKNIASEKIVDENREKELQEQADFLKKKAEKAEKAVKAVKAKPKKKAEKAEKAVKPEKKMLLENLIAIPKKANDDFVNLLLNKQTKINTTPGKLVNLDVSQIDNMPLEMQAAMFFLCNRKSIKGYRFIANPSNYTGGIRLALCSGKNNSANCIISNTNRKFTFQSQAGLLDLIALKQAASALGFVIQEQSKSYVQFYMKKISDNQKLISAAIKLLK